MSDTPYAPEQDIERAKRRLRAARLSGNRERQARIEALLRAQRQRVFDADEMLATHGYLDGDLAQLFPRAPRKEESA